MKQILLTNGDACRKLSYDEIREIWKTGKDDWDVMLSTSLLLLLLNSKTENIDITSIFTDTLSNLLGEESNPVLLLKYLNKFFAVIEEDDKIIRVYYSSWTQV